MDDCDLQKLAVKPGKLSPTFNKNVTDYTICLAANVDKFTIDLFTSDTGASYTIKVGDGSKTIQLQEGETKLVCIEVTAEDGRTIKNYNINAKRLSPKDATLNNLTIAPGKLVPDFNSLTTLYQCFVPANICSVKVTPSVADPKCSLSVCGEKPGGDTFLCYGETRISVSVTSADGSNTQAYTLTVVRKQLPRHITLSDTLLASEVEDPISLSVLYRPIRIKGTDPPHIFSRELIEFLTRTTKVDPLDQLPLPSDWQLDDQDTEKRIAEAQGKVVLTFGGYSEVGKVQSLGAKLKDYCKPPKIEENKGFVHTKVSHELKVRSWEKHLQQIHDESNPDKLCKAADQALEKYFGLVPDKQDYRIKFKPNQSPIDYLNTASYCLATALATKNKDAALHLRLGLVLEEKYWIQDMLGLKAADDAGGLKSANQAAYESGREDEVQAICKLRGYQPGCPVALQLKALDEEYHNLIDQGQRPRADAVQNLFLWKSKQTSQEGAAAQKAESEESTLGQAYMKYMDALVCEDAKAVYNFQVGRMLLTQGNYPDAVKRLESALSWNSRLESARFCLGLALGSLKDEITPARQAEAVRFLLEGTEIFLIELSNQALQEDEIPLKRSKLYGEEFFHLNNTLILRGVVTLGKLLLKGATVKETMSPKDVFHTGALLASMLLPRLAKGDVYTQVEWTLLDCHANLLDLLSAEKPPAPGKVIQKRCQRLSALVQATSIPMNDQLISLQEKTCQQLVWADPCNSVALYQLGQVQLSRAESSQPSTPQHKTALDAAMAAYKAAIDLEGKPTAGEPPKVIQDQPWWQARKKKEEQDSKAKDKAAAPATQPTSKGQTPAPAPAAAGRGRGGAGTTAPARGAPAGRGTAPSGGRGGAKAAAPPAARGGAAAKPAGRGAPAGRGGAAAGKTAVAGKPAAAASAPTAPPKVEEAPAPPEKPRTPSPTPAKPTKPAPMNRKSYLPRMGLARTLRLAGNTAEAHKYYDAVIKMAPEIHDAYIESAEMLVGSGDSVAAVDMYARFPIDEHNLTFDDAYIFGEIVTILMKAQKYDDKRLPQFMIKWGKVLGLGVLEKHIDTLQDKFKTEVCKQVYAGVNGKSVDDPDLKAFFKMKCWD